MAKKKKTSKSDNGYSEADSSNEILTAEEVSEKYTVVELKKILKENDLSVSGRKKDLVERVLPILNADTAEEVSDDLELTEKAEESEAKKVVLEQTKDSADDEDPLTSTLGIFGINYVELSIKDESVKGEKPV